MPVNKNVFRRLSAIAQILNDRVGVGPLNVSKIHFALNWRYEIECCKSTVEKDLFTLRMDFDMPMHTVGKKGYYLKERFDFLQALKSYLNLID
jgi:hypothetical protein